MFFGCKDRLGVSVEKSDGGGVTKGGGDSIFCAPDAALKVESAKYGRPYLEGLLNFDYLQTFKPNQYFEAPAGSRWESYRDYIRTNLLRLINPISVNAKERALLESFDSFFNSIENQNNNRSRVWTATQLELHQFKDEELEIDPPRNCLNQQGQPNLLQLIERDRNPQQNKVYYRYNQKELNNLKATPLQYSFLMTHEWLWDLTQSRWSNRRMNALMHSKRWSELTPKAFEEEFLNLIEDVERYANDSVPTKDPSAQSQNNDEVRSLICKEMVNSSLTFGSANRFFVFNTQTNKWITDFSNQVVYGMTRDECESTIYSFHGGLICSASGAGDIGIFTTSGRRIPGIFEAFSGRYGYTGFCKESLEHRTQNLVCSGSSGYVAAYRIADGTVIKEIDGSVDQHSIISLAFAYSRCFAEIKTLEALAKP